MIRIANIVGNAAEPAIHKRIHHISHHGVVDVLNLSTADMSRRRLRTRLQSGGELFIALPRDQRLSDGAVLLLDEAHAIVVRADPEKWLKLTPTSQAEALQLGYHAGNLHWRVSFTSGSMFVAVEHSAESYLARLTEAGMQGGFGVSVEDKPA